MRSFRDLDAWREAHALVLMVYAVTKAFPSEERFGLVSQMRRAAVSVPANIAEGFKRRGLREKIRFYNVAEGSLEELKYFFILAQDLGYIGSKERADGTGQNRRPPAPRSDQEHGAPSPLIHTPYSILP